VGNMVKREHITAIPSRVGSESEQKTCNISETRQAKSDQGGYFDGLIGSRIRAFDWYQNQCADPRTLAMALLW